MITGVQCLLKLQILDQMLIQLLKTTLGTNFKSHIKTGRGRGSERAAKKTVVEKTSVSVLDGDGCGESSVFHHRCACFSREINSISFEISSFDLKVLSNQVGLDYHQHFGEEG